MMYQNIHNQGGLLGPMTETNYDPNYFSGQSIPASEFGNTPGGQSIPWSEMQRNFWANAPNDPRYAGTSLNYDELMGMNTIENFGQGGFDSEFGGLQRPGTMMSGPEAGFVGPDMMPSSGVPEAPVPEAPVPEADGTNWAGMDAGQQQGMMAMARMMMQQNQAQANQNPLANAPGITRSPGFRPMQMGMSYTGGGLLG